MDFVSIQVSSGFTSACALIVFTSQMKNLLGIKAEGPTFLKMWTSIFQEIHHINWNDCFMGVGCIVFLLTLRFIGTLRSNKILWIFGISRNALAVGICLYIGYWSKSSGKNLFTLSGYIPAGLPEIKLPDFSIENQSFIELIQEMSSGLIVIPLMALLETYSACKAFAEGQSIDVTQELITNGVSNILNSFFQGYRINGGLTRSAINKASGARTQMSNFYIGFVVVISLLYLTPYFAYIPKSCLAAVLISAVIFMVQYKVIKPLWRSKKLDLIPGFAALLGCLIFPLHIGVFIGIGVDFIYLFYRFARPSIKVQVLKVSYSLHFRKIKNLKFLVPNKH
uniref:SLC26A/SulP transporter domain-containing protein n=1 Tax=Megaselia scalaris TaxID=36166 RepID=T1GGA7_MEGSC